MLEPGTVNCQCRLRLPLPFPCIHRKSEVGKRLSHFLWVRKLRSCAACAPIAL